jgi:hypothetical protein
MITEADIAGISSVYEGRAVALALWNEKLRAAQSLGRANQEEWDMPPSTDRIYGAPVCRGSYLLGTACGECVRCQAHMQKPSVVKKPRKRPT